MAALKFLTDFRRYKEDTIKLQSRPASAVVKKAFGLLVQLGSYVAVFTPAAYQRSILLRPSRKTHLGAGFALRCFQRLS